MTFSNVISLIALFVALTGGAYAAVKLKPNQVKSKNIAPDAVQGIDANESSFGTVPRAANADHANNAANADDASNASALDGFSSADFQNGNGLDNAIAGTIPAGNTVPAGIFVFEGGVGILCDASPELVYVDFGPDSFDTDLWINGSYQSVADEADSTHVPLTAAGDTAEVHIWGGGGTVAHVVASVFWDGGNNECRVAFTSQENRDTGFAPASASTRSFGEARAARSKAADGWVTLNPHR